MGMLCERRSTNGRERGLGRHDVLDADADEAGDGDGAGVALVGADLADLGEVAWGERTRLQCSPGAAVAGGRLPAIDGDEVGAPERPGFQLAFARVVGAYRGDVLARVQPRRRHQRFGRGRRGDEDLVVPDGVLGGGHGLGADAGQVGREPFRQARGPAAVPSPDLQAPQRPNVRESPRLPICLHPRAEDASGGRPGRGEDVRDERSAAAVLMSER